jgi:hypothetical protein
MFVPPINHIVSPLKRQISNHIHTTQGRHLSFSVVTIVGETRKFVKVISSGLWAVDRHMKAATNLLDFGFIAVTDTQERGM